MGPALKWLVQLEEPEIRSVVWCIEIRLWVGMDRRERLDLDHNQAAVRRDRRMPEEHSVAREEGRPPGAEVNESQVSTLVALHVPMGVLEAVKHAAAHYGDEGSPPHLDIAHDVAGYEIMHQPP